MTKSKIVRVHGLKLKKHAKGGRPRQYQSLRLDSEMVEYLKRSPAGISKMVEAALFAVYGHMLASRRQAAAAPEVPE